MFEEDKIEKLEELLKSIKNKTNTIESQTRFLNSFNRKMEILLNCFKAYEIEGESEEKEITADKKITEKIKTVKEHINVDIKLEPNTEVKRTKISLESQIEKIFESNQIEKQLAKTIFNLIKVKEYISLDELVKGIKSSKYKVIEVINGLIKERIIVKSYEKGFVYRISREGMD